LQAIPASPCKRRLQARASDTCKPEQATPASPSKRRLQNLTLYKIMNKIRILTITYFQPAETKSLTGNASYPVHDGIFANNPAMPAIAEARKSLASAQTCIPHLDFAEKLQKRTLIYESDPVCAT
jgi:hypothetical protein